MKSVTIVILVVIVIGALVLGLWRSGIIGGRPPSEVMDMPTTVIDTETMELVEVPTGDFEQDYRIDPETGYRIHPDGRKLARPDTCVNCGARIPPIPLPEGIDDDAEQAARDAYPCPECGRTAYVPAQ